MQFRPRLGFWPSACARRNPFASIRAPIFVLAGTADPLTRLPEAERLFAAAPEPKDSSGPSRARSHENLMLYANDEYRRRVGAFLAGNLHTLTP